MKTKHFSKRASIAALVVWLLLLVLWLVASDSSGDTAIALGFIFLIAFIFISIPLWIVSGLAILTDISRKRWHVYILVINTFGHVYLAHEAGFLDNIYQEANEQLTTWKDPALAKLRLAILRGPVKDDTEVRVALADGADPNAMSHEENGLPLITIAASRADILTLSALIDAGANINLVANTTFGYIQSPKPIDLVLFASQGKAIESMKLLISRGADTSTSQLLNGACYRGDIELFQELKDLVSSTQFDSRGYNCIHLAVEKRQHEFLKNLFESEAGSDWLNDQINLASSNGSTPFDMAVTKQRYQSALLIYTAGGRPGRNWTYERVSTATGQTPEEVDALNLLRQLITLEDSD